MLHNKAGLEMLAPTLVAVSASLRSGGGNEMKLCYILFEQQCHPGGGGEEGKGGGVLTSWLLPAHQ